MDSEQNETRFQERGIQNRASAVLKSIAAKYLLSVYATLDYKYPISAIHTDDVARYRPSRWSLLVEEFLP